MFRSRFRILLGGGEDIDCFAMELMKVVMVFLLKLTSMEREKNDVIYRSLLLYPESRMYCSYLQLTKLGKIAFSIAGSRWIW